jgi:hypothetical protein
VNLWPEWDVFWPSLGAWAIRGVLCALSGLVWAVEGGYIQPFQSAEMARGW